MPVESTNFGLDQFSKFSGSHPNPMFTYLQSFLPRRLKDLFELIEYVFYNSPHIFAAVDKFTSYPITEINVLTDNNDVKKAWEEVFEIIEMKSQAMKIGLDLHLYGNSFTSVLRPRNRILVCPTCSTHTDASHVPFKYNKENVRFMYHCPKCNKDVSAKAKDIISNDLSKVRLIRWSPKDMEILHNPITDASSYFYRIPPAIKDRVERNDRVLISGLPLEFLEAIKDDADVKFKPGEIFHMRLPAPAGLQNPAWGMPPTTALIQLFFYTAALRKANEAIALDHVAPLRILHPAAISGQGDPVEQINMAKWTKKMEEAIKMWRVDPNHISVMPSALGTTMLGGQARALMTVAEIKEAENDIIAGMGIPREFLYGGLTATGSGVTLRMLENQFETYMGYQHSLLNFVIKKLAPIVDKDVVKAKWRPFRLIDDVQQKQLALQANGFSNVPIVSRETQTNILELDYEEEKAKIRQETIDDARAQMEIQRETQEIMTSLAEQSRMEAGGGEGLNYDIQAIMQQADMMAQQLTQMDHGTVQSSLDQLSQTDPVMYAVVKDRYETYKSQMPQQHAAQPVM